MKTNVSEQSSVWQVAFAEGLARGEAAFGAGDRNAMDFAESYAALVEAEHVQTEVAADAVPKAVMKNEAKASWAKAFERIG